MVCDVRFGGLPCGKARATYIFLVYWVARQYLVHTSWSGQDLVLSAPTRPGNSHLVRSGLDKFADESDPV